MDKRTYWICTLIVVIVVVSVIYWAVQAGNPIVAVIVLLWAMGTLYLCRTRVHEVIEDERNIRINERAAMRAIEVFVIIGVLAGVVLYAISNQESDYTQAGLVLGISVTALLLLYATFQTYYSRLPGEP